MTQAKMFNTPEGRELAYHYSEGAGPCVVFLGGLKSDMQGTKAVYLEDWAKAEGRAFLRFDYSGHGESSGRFEEGCIGDWHEDTLAAIDALTKGPLVVVGSSMGGWQALLLARARPERIDGLVGQIANQETMKESIDLNTRMAAETNFMLGQMWRLNAAAGLAQGQTGVNWAAEQAKERSFFDYSGTAD